MNERAIYPLQKEVKYENQTKYFYEGKIISYEEYIKKNNSNA
jgi:hypothetical protein